MKVPRTPGFEVKIEGLLRMNTYLAAVEVGESCTPAAIAEGVLRHGCPEEHKLGPCMRSHALSLSNFETLKNLLQIEPTTWIVKTPEDCSLDVLI
jgi:hypothetical protein